MAALENQHQYIKEKYPDVIVWFVVGEFIECINDCADYTAHVCGLSLTHKEGAINRLAGFPVKRLEENMRKIVKTGRRVAIIEQQ